MALIGNHADTLLHGLSDFWLRYFKDIGDLQAIYEGTEILLGQHYLNLLNDVLNISVSETPLFRKEYCKLYTIQQDQLVYRMDAAGLVERDRFVFQPETPLIDVPQLQNKVFAATASLEQGFDYDISDGNIAFKHDPFESEETEAFARRPRNVPVAGYFQSAELAGARCGDEVEILLPVVQGGVATHYLPLKVVHAAPGRVAISASTPLPDRPPVPVTYAWRLVRTDALGGRHIIQDRAQGVAPADFSGVLQRDTVLTVDELAFWAIDAKLDDGRLFNTFGYLFGSEERSTEIYRSFIRGLMQLYTHGPAIERVESALNVVARYDVVRDDGEVLQGHASGLVRSGTGTVTDAAGDTAVIQGTFDPGYVGGFLSVVDATLEVNKGTFTVTKYIDTHHVRVHRAQGTFANDANVAWEFSYDDLQRVTTSAREYVYPRTLPLREAITNPANHGNLVLHAFEPLTDAIAVTDYVQDPDWWHGITIPESLLPNEPTHRRIASTALYSDYLGLKGNFNIGDVGYFIGADEYGDVSDNPLRHGVAFILLDRFLKTHLFRVRVDPSVMLTGLLLNDLYDLIRNVKPAHTQVYFQPVTAFEDSVSALDQELQRRARLPLADNLPIVDNLFRIGDHVFIGFDMAYAYPNGGELQVPGVGVSLILGGMNPSVAINPGGVFERVLSVTPRSA